MSDTLWCVVLVAVFTVGAFVVDAKICDGKTADIGMEGRYKVLGGCQIKQKDIWIPLENYRVL